MKLLNHKKLARCTCWHLFIAVVLWNMLAGCQFVSQQGNAEINNLSKQPVLQQVINSSNPLPDASAEMLSIPGGEFTMGAAKQSNTNDAQPLHKVKVPGFQMDATEVTNAQFAAFVKATGYKTIAETPVNWEEIKLLVAPGTPKPADADLQPGSLVFNAPKSRVPLNNMTRWWVWMKNYPVGLFLQYQKNPPAVPPPANR